MLTGYRQGVGSFSYMQYVKIFTIFIGLWLFLAGCSQTSDVEHVEKAREFENKLDYKAAIIEYKNAININSDNVAARFSLGRIYARIGDVESAKKELGIAYKKGYEKDQVRLLLAKLLVSARQYENVLEEISSSPAADDRIAAAIYSYLGIAHLEKGEFDKAKKLISSAVALAPGSADALYGQAYLYFVKRDYDRALDILNRLIVSSAELVESHLLLADIYFIKSNYQGSEDSYRQVLENEPQKLLTLYSLRANLGLIRSLVAQRKFELAKERVDFVLSKAPNNPMSLYFGGVIAYQKQDYDLAEQYLLKVINSIPNHMPSLLLLGAINFQQKELEQAGEYLNSYLARDPRNVQARKLLAATRMKLRQPDFAMEALEPILEQMGDDVSLLTIAGSVAVRSGNFDVGTSYLEKAVSVMPDNEIVRTELALAYLADSDLEKAIKELEVVSSGSSSDATKKANLLLVLTYLQNKDNDNALNEAKRFLSKYPEEPVAHNLVGVVYGHIGNKQAAENEFRNALDINPQYTPAIVNLAKIAQRSNDFAKAEELYESILSYDDGNVSVMVALSRIAQEMGDVDLAVNWLERAAHSDSNSVLPRLRLAHHYLSVKDYIQARKYAAEIREISPDFTDLFLVEGLIDLAEGKIDSALLSFGKLLNLEPKSIVGLYYRGVSYGLKRQYKLAKQSLEQALAVDPKHLLSVILLARVEMELGNLKRSAKLLDLVKSKAPDSAATYVLTADLLYKQRKYDKAIALYEKAMQLRPRESLLLKIVKTYRMLGNRQGLYRVLEDWLGHKPNSYQARLILAREQEQQGDTSSAIENYEVLLNARPNDPLVLNNIAWLYLSLDRAIAKEYAEKAYKYESEDPFILDTLGWILIQDGELERGTALLRKAVSLDSDIADIQYHLAMALIKLGENEEAKHLLKKLLDNPEGLSIGVDVLKRNLQDL